MKTKKNSSHLIMKYISCRLVTFVVILLACIYLSYYFSLSSLSDEFLCSIKSGVLKNDSTIPDRFQCKLIAVGIFQLLSLINLIVYALLIPVVVYTFFIPFRQKTDILKVYEILPTFDVLHFKSEGYNDLSLYNLFLEENISELKSYKCLKVLENIKSNGQGIDPMLLLTNLGMIKMDIIDGKIPTSLQTKGEDQGSQRVEFKGRVGSLSRHTFLPYPACHLNPCSSVILQEPKTARIQGQIGVILAPKKDGSAVLSLSSSQLCLVVLSVFCVLSHIPPRFLAPHIFVLSSCLYLWSLCPSVICSLTISGVFTAYLDHIQLPSYVCTPYVCTPYIPFPPSYCLYVL